MDETIYSGPTLVDESHRRALAAMQHNYPEPGHLAHVRAFHTADFSDPEDVPGGLLAIHDLDATVHVDSLPLNAFSYLTITPVKNIEGKKKWTDADFQGKEARIHEACPQFTSAPATLEDTGKSWRAELGEDENAFVGVFKQTVGRETRYFIAAQAGAPMATRELREELRREPLTFRQLLADKRYNRVQSLAKRNSERLAYNLSRALGVPVDSIADRGTTARVVVPQVSQAVSTLEHVTFNEDTKVGIFNKLAPVSRAASQVYVYEGPYHGIAVFDMSKTRGGVGLALPSHSGRVADAPRVRDVASRCEGLLCEGSIAQHPDVATESFNSVRDESFLENMRALGWRDTALRANLVPVQVKIYDPSIKRV